MQIFTKIFHREGKCIRAYYDKGRNPERKTWKAAIHYKGKIRVIPVGRFIDPLSASIVSEFVGDEIYA